MRSKRQHSAFRARRNHRRVEGHHDPLGLFQQTALPTLGHSYAHLYRGTSGVTRIPAMISIDRRHPENHSAWSVNNGVMESATNTLMDKSFFPVTSMRFVGQSNFKSTPKIYSVRSERLFP